MAIVHTAHGATAGSSTAATSKAVTVTAVAGEAIIVAVTTVNTLSNAPTDNATGGSNKYVQLGSLTTNTVRVTLWGCLQSKSAVTAVTCTFTSSRYSIAIDTYTGVVGFNQSNTTTNTGSTTPATATLPHALGTNSFAFAACTDEGTSTWSASTGNLRNNLAGAGSTTPGVANVDNTTTTCAATQSSSGVWAVTIIELLSFIVADQPLGGLAEDEITVGDVMDFGSPQYQFVATEDEYHRFDATNRVAVYDHIQDTDEPGFVGVPPVALQDDGDYKFDAGWRAIQHDDTDTQSASQVIPPVVIYAVLEQEFEQFKPKEQGSVYDHTSETDEPGMAPTPPVSQEGRFGLAEIEITVGDVLDLVIPLAPPFASEDEFFLRPTASFDWLQSDDPDSYYPPTPVVVINTAVDDLESQFKVWEQKTVYDPTSETDEPGGLSAPPFAIQEEGEIERNLDWHAPALEDDLSSAAPTPPFSIQEAEDLQRWLAWSAPALEDDQSYVPFVPTVFQEELILWSTQFVSIDAQDIDGYYPPAPPPQVVFEGWEFDEYLMHAQDLVILIQEDDWATYPPSPLIAYEGRYVVAEEEITVGMGDPAFGIGTPIPFASEDEFYQQQVITYGLFQPDDPEGYYPQTPIIVIYTAADDLESQRTFDWRAFAVEDDWVTYPPAPPTATEQDSEQQIWIAWKQSFADDAESQSEYPPLPFAIVEDGELERRLDWSAPAIEDDWRALPPTPPVIEEISIDEISEKWVAWTALQPEEIELNLTVPTPPSAIDQDTEQAKTVSWSTPIIEDDARALPPTPPSSIQEDGEQERRMDWSAPALEDELNFPIPSPPSAIDQDSEQAKAVGWSAPAIEDDARALPPTPPVAIDQDTEQSVWTTSVWRQPDDEAQAFPATPPTTYAEDTDSSRWFATSSIQYDDTDTERAGAPTPPYVLQDEIAERWTAWFAIDAEDFDSYYPPAPPPTVIQGIELDEFQQKYIGWSAPAIEDDARALPPTPPQTDQVDELQQKNVDWLVKQVDDTETQRNNAPTPPSVLQDEISETTPIAWKTSALEDDTRALPPTPPSAIQEDGEHELNVAWKSPALEDDHSFEPPRPPSAVDQDTEQAKAVGWSAPALEDDARALPPTPPSAIQDESEQAEFVGWFALQPEDIEADIQTPRPPFAITDESDTDLAWRVTILQPDDPDSYYPPTPIIVVPQFGPDDVPSMWTAWSQMWHDDTETERIEPPTPPPADDSEVSKWVATNAQQGDDLETQRNEPPTPPIVRDDDLFVLVQWVAWTSIIIEDPASRETPIPPYAIDQDTAEALWRDVLQVFHADEETQQNAPPVPPVAIQDDAEWQKFVGWIAELVELVEVAGIQPPPPSVFMRLCDIYVRGRLGIFNLEQGGQIRCTGISVKLLVS